MLLQTWQCQKVPIGLILIIESKLLRESLLMCYYSVKCEDAVER